MSDTQFAAYEAKCATAARLNAEILPYNKQVLFEALAAAGINIVTIAFDGSGDSGQFEGPVSYDSENREVAIPIDYITVKSVDFDTGTIFQHTTTVGEYIETHACDFLEGTHEGWEDGEGAHGEFRFSLGDRTFTLDYNGATSNPTTMSTNFRRLSWHIATITPFPRRANGAASRRTTKPFTTI